MSPIPTSFIEASSNSESEESQKQKENNEFNYVNKLLNTENFRSYMLNTYEIVPMLINKRRIRRFLEMTQEFEEYSVHIESWNTNK